MDSFIPILMDIASIFIILSFVFSAYKKGFAVTAVSLISLIMSFMIAIFLSRIIAVFIYDNFLKENLFNLLAEKINSVGTSQPINETITLAFAGLPEFLLNMIKNEISNLGENINNFIANSSESIAKVLLENVISPVVLTGIKSVLFIIIFIICRIIFSILCAFLSLVTKIPIISTIDGILGIALGGVKGLVFMTLLAWLTVFIIDISNNSLPYITTDVIDSTYIFQKFLNLSKII